VGGGGGFCEGSTSLTGDIGGTWEPGKRSQFFKRAYTSMRGKKVKEIGESQVGEGGKGQLSIHNDRGGNKTLIENWEGKRTPGFWEGERHYLILEIRTRGNCGITYPEIVYPPIARKGTPYFGAMDGVQGTKEYAHKSEGRLKLNILIRVARKTLKGGLKGEVMLEKKGNLLEKLRRGRVGTHPNTCAYSLAEKERGIRKRRGVVVNRTRGGGGGLK